MKKRRNSKFVNFFFRDFDNRQTEENIILPKMKRSKTNKEMLMTSNQEDINKRIINKVHYNFIFNQFNIYCKKDNKKFSQKYINNLSDLLFTNSRSYSSYKKNNISIQTNSNINKKRLFMNTNNNFFEKDSFDNNKEENIYNFGMKINNKENKETLKIYELKRKYNFFTLPISLKDKINAKKIVKLFNSKSKIDLKNNNIKVKEKILKRMKIHSLLDKKRNFFAEIKDLKNIEKKNKKKNIKIIERNKEKDKNNGNKTNDLNDIEKFIKNNLKNNDYFNSFSIKDSQYELDKPKNHIKTNIFLNYMKLKQRNESSKFIFHSK